ncbi:MAG: hypothetical protein ABEH77_02460, partial [Halobacteriaceae archaeon]
LVAAAVAAPALADTGGARQAQPTTEPGSRLAGVIGVQQAEVGAEVETRSLDRQLAAADSNASKAAVVAEQVGASRERLAALRERLARLEEMRANGTISESEYRGRVAPVAARIEAIRAVLNRTEAAARDIPAAALEKRGVNATAIRRLRAEADSLTGPEVAEIARSIAGRGAGSRATGPPPGVGPPGDRGQGGPPADRGGDGGPPEDAGNTGGNRTGPPDDGAPGGDEADRAGQGGAGDSGGSGQAEGNGQGNAGDRGRGNGGA